MVRLIAEALARHYPVTVLAGRPSYDPAERHGRYVLGRFTDGRVVVERVGSTTRDRRRLASRLLNYGSYLALAVPRALMLDIGAVIAMTDPPLAGIAGAMVARSRGVPFVYNIRDLYPDLVLETGLVRRATWVRAWEQAQRWALRRAARVIVLGEDMRERVVSKGVRPEKVVVVRDGASTTGPHAMASGANAVRQQVRAGFRFVVMHAGNLGVAGAWQTVSRAIALSTHDGVGWVFVGDGVARAELASSLGGTGTVRFLPYQPAEAVPHLLAAGDLHIVTVRRGLEGVVVPSKLYGILAAGRPVLAVAPERSDVARIVRQTGCGVVADPDDPSAIVRAVRAASGAPDRLQEMAQRARQAALAFEQTEQIQRYVQVIGEAVARHPKS
jgi:glycosyltransferase involved in cell wall biosynthesis